MTLAERTNLKVQIAGVSVVRVKVENTDYWTKISKEDAYSMVDKLTYNTAWITSDEFYGVGHLIFVR